MSHRHYVRRYGEQQETKGDAGEKNEQEEKEQEEEVEVKDDNDNDDSKNNRSNYSNEYDDGANHGSGSVDDGADGGDGARLLRPWQCWFGRGIRGRRRGEVGAWAELRASILSRDHRGSFVRMAMVKIGWAELVPSSEPAEGLPMFACYFYLFVFTMLIVLKA